MQQRAPANLFHLRNPMPRKGMMCRSRRAPSILLAAAGVGKNKMTELWTDRLRRVTSRQNSLLKELRHTFAQAEPTADGFIAVEGVHLLEEALRSGLRVKAVFFAEHAQERARRLLPQIAQHTETLLVPDEAFRSAVATETPQGVAALVRLKTFHADDVLAAPEPLLLAAAGVQDPGNLGTMLRSAEAFGATAALLVEGTVSPFNPKVSRASAGSLFRLPVLRMTSAEALVALRQRGIRVVATSSHKGVRLDEVELRGPVAIFVGGEGAGVPREVLGAADQAIAIPHAPRVESLNARRGRQHCAL